MDKAIDWAFKLPIGIMYNRFFYQLANSVYNGQSFNEKRSNAITMFIIAAVSAVVGSKWIIEKHDTIGEGIKLGGYILLFTTFVNFWNFMGEDIKLLATGIALVGFIWLARQYKAICERRNKDKLKKVKKKCKKKLKKSKK